MLDHARTLLGYKLRARDGEIGSIKDFYFDDQFWTIRYVVAGTGSWMTGRKVLLSPYAMEAVHPNARDIVTTLSKKQIEDSPALSSDKPVSRQFEENYYSYYGWPSYWGGPYMWGTYPSISRNPESWTPAAPDQKSWDPHLRSMDAVRGYRVQAADGEIGHIADFIIDDESWAIRYLVIDTRNWWAGKKVLIAPDWIERISWEESKVFVTHTRTMIQQAPEFGELSHLNREFEGRLHEHYQRPGYWQGELTTTRPG